MGLNNFTEEEKRRARRADLFEFLHEHHADQLRYDGYEWVKFRPNPSIGIHKGACSFKDFSTGESGNSLDFLVNYLGYDIVDAVHALCDAVPSELETGGAASNSYTLQSNTLHISNRSSAQGKRVLVLPEAEPGSYRRVFAYLTQRRGISAETVQKLINSKLLYQSREHGNIVFVNPERDWGEWRGTSTFAEESSGRKYRGMLAGSRQDGFWWFRTGSAKTAEAAYICEGAIDAISLYELHMMHREHNAEVAPDLTPIDAYYISIGGCEKKAALERIAKSLRGKAYVSFLPDNDAAGRAAMEWFDQWYQEAFPGHRPILGLPKEKDWNDVLMRERSKVQAGK